MIGYYLKPEFVDTKEAKEIDDNFWNWNTDWALLFKVPVDDGDRITAFLRRAVKPNYMFHRRTGGGKRYDSQRLTVRRADATYFKYYIRRRPKPEPVVPTITMFVPRPALPRCSCCGQLLP